MAHTDAALVFVEHHIQHPMHAVFDPPMAADCFGKARHIRVARQGVAPFGRGLRCRLAFGLDHADSGQALPLVCGVEIGELLRLRDEGVPPGLDPPVGFRNLLNHTVSHLLIPILSGILKRVMHLPIQRGMGAFQREHVVATLLHNLLRNAFLTAHGVNGDGAALQMQHTQQLGDGRDFVRFGIRGEVSQHEAIVRTLGAHQMQRGFAVCGIMRAVQGFAINGDDRTVGLLLDQRDPSQKTLAKLLRVEGRKDAPKGVMRRNAMGEVEHGA